MKLSCCIRANTYQSVDVFNVSLRIRKYTLHYRKEIANCRWAGKNHCLYLIILNFLREFNPCMIYCFYLGIIDVKFIKIIPFESNSSFRKEFDAPLLGIIIRVPGLSDNFLNNFKIPKVE